MQVMWCLKAVGGSHFWLCQNGILSEQLKPQVSDFHRAKQAHFASADLRF